MKVHELIELLQDCNQDADVMVDLGVQTSRFATWTSIPMDVVGIWAWPSDGPSACEVCFSLESSRTQEEPTS